MRMILLSGALILGLHALGFAAECPNTQDAKWVKCLLDNCAKSGYEPAIGMTTTIAERSRWCFPTDKTTNTTSHGTAEYWHYSKREKASGEKYGPVGMLYFENGILISIQQQSR